MTAVLAPNAVVRRAPVARRSVRDRLGSFARAHGEALGLLVVVWAAYIAVAAVIAFRYDAVPLDSISRLDDGANVIFSSSPHLAAVGFVWNPLPSLTEIPLLLLRNVWPALLARGFAAGIMSALFMASAVVGVRGILADRGAGRIGRLGLPLLFAAMPYVLLYGGDGLSEAFFVCFLVWATRSFLRYVERDESGDLVSAGVYLGLAYLTRYEAAAAAVGAALLLLVVVVGNPRRANPAQKRGLLVDLLLGVGPFGLTFVGWAVASAVIVHEPFPQFSSAYGNSSQVGESKAVVQAQTGQGSTRAFGYVAHQLFALMPLALLVVVVAIVVARSRRSWLPLVPLALFGSVLAFEVLAFLAGETFGWLRFYIMVIPLTVCTLAELVPVGRISSRAALDDAMVLGMRRSFLGLGVVAVLAVGYVTQWHVLGNGSIAREEYVTVHQPLQGDRTLIDQTAAYERAAATINALGASRGTILTEASDSVELRTKAARQNVFLDTTDPHFARDVADPVRFGIRYILVAKPADSFDQLDVTYPTLWQDGAGFGPMIADFPQTPEHYRLYRITATSTPTGVGAPLG